MNGVYQSLAFVERSLEVFFFFFFFFFLLSFVERFPLPFQQLGTDFCFTCTTRYAVWGAANYTNQFRTNNPIWLYVFNHSISFDPWGKDFDYCNGHSCKYKPPSPSLPLQILSLSLFPPPPRPCCRAPICLQHLLLDLLPPNSGRDRTCQEHKPLLDELRQIWQPQ